MNALRHESRIAIERTAVLTCHGQRSECRLSDFTEHGFRLHTDVLSPVVGQVFDLTCALDSEQAIECRVAVTHVHSPHVGVHIVEITPTHQERLSRFIEDVITVNIDGTVIAPREANPIRRQWRGQPASHLIPILCLFGVIVLVSAITPAIKYTLQHRAVDFLELAANRVAIAFLFLAGITMWFDVEGLRSLTARECGKLTLLGLLGVGGYPIAAWGLVYTSVTHFAMIYSLLPTFTTLLSIARGKDHANIPTMTGLLVSWTGCALAVLAGPSDPGVGWGVGDALILLFTLMMSCYLVLSPNVLKRAGAWTANTIMFGTTSLVIFLVEAMRGTVPSTGPTSFGMGLLLFIGTATAGVFLLRSRALQSLSPAVVGAYHNLIPICTIGLACLWLSEAVSLQTLVGALGVVAGTELIRRAPRFRPVLGGEHVDVAKASHTEVIFDIDGTDIAPDMPARVA
ncbi:MAG TPA: EamA family transporter [Nitrospira sp.]|nr:EamA family transporter [Nitrospira sp.]